MRGGAGFGKCCVYIGFQFVGFCLFAEDLGIGINALFCAGKGIFGVGRHFYGGGKGGEPVKCFGGAPAGDDELGGVGVQGFVVRFEQCADFLCFVYRGFQVVRIGFVYACADGYAECGECVQRA